MRRYDKKQNIAKANLLAEQTYLKSKGLINEELNEGIHDRDILSRPISNPSVEPSNRSSDELGIEADGRSETILRMKYRKEIANPSISDDELRYLLSGKGVTSFGGRPNAIEKIIKNRNLSENEDTEDFEKASREVEYGINSYDDSDINTPKKIEDTEFKIGDSIENAGNDGSFYRLNSNSEEFVQYPGELSGEIIDIKNGFYILKAKYKGKDWGEMIRVKTDDTQYRKKRLVDDEGNVHVGTYHELMRELRRNYDMRNVTYTGVENRNMYFWLEPEEDMIGGFQPEKGEIWYKPQNPNMREEKISEYDNYNYPAGADADRNAPWHQSDSPEYKDFEIVDDGDNSLDFSVELSNVGGGSSSAYLYKILDSINASEEVVRYFDQALTQYPRPNGFMDILSNVVEKYAHKADFDYPEPDLDPPEHDNSEIYHEAYENKEQP